MEASRRKSAAILFVLGVGFAGAGCAPRESKHAGDDVAPPDRPTGMEHLWNFDDIVAGELPRGWKAEATNPRGPVAIWEVSAADGAPVLALTDTKQGEGATFNVCWTDRVSFLDGVIAVKVKAGSGEEDQGGGPIWRVRDRDNYYVVRWNPLEDNFRLYVVEAGARKMLATAKFKADRATWHTIRVEQKGDEIECRFDGTPLLRARDKTFPGAGGVGLWTKADAATSFDDLSVGTGER